MGTIDGGLSIYEPREWRGTLTLPCPVCQEEIQISVTGATTPLQINEGLERTIVEGITVNRTWTLHAHSADQYLRRTYLT